MMQRLAPVLFSFALVCVLGVASSAFSASIARGETPTALDERIQFVSASGEIDEEAVRKAVAKRADGTQLEFGPASSEVRPGHSFFMFRLPADTTAKDAERLAKKGGRKPKSLLLSSVQFLRADGEEVMLTEGLRIKAVRERIMGMTSEVRWVFAAGSVMSVLYEPGRMDSDELLKRLEVEAQAYLPADGRVVYLRDELLWKFEGEVSAAKAKSLAKKLRRREGVVDCGIDAASGRVRIVVAYDQLTTSGPWITAEAPDEESEEMSSEEADEPSYERPTFFVNPLLEELLKAGFTLPD